MNTLLPWRELVTGVWWVRVDADTGKAVTGISLVRATDPLPDEKTPAWYLNFFVSGKKSSHEHYSRIGEVMVSADLRARELGYQLEDPWDALETSLNRFKRDDVI